MLTSLTKGGGGYGSYGGGGSGYIQYFSQNLSSTPEMIRLTIGNEMEESNFTIANQTIRSRALNRSFQNLPMQKG